MFDDTVMVISYVDPALVTDATLAKLHSFLHRMGRDARQGEIGIVAGGQYHGVTDADHDLARTDVRRRGG